MINNRTKVYFLFILMAIFAVPTAHSVLTIDDHHFVCKFEDSRDNTDSSDNEIVNSHCDKCFFNIEKDDFFNNWGLLFSLDSNKLLLQTISKYNNSNSYISFHSRSPPTV